MIFFECFYSTWIIILIITSYIFLISSLIFYFDFGLSLKNNFFGSLSHALISFFVVGYDNNSIITLKGKRISLMNGLVGMILMGFFISSSYSSFQNYALYRSRIPNDKKVLRILGEIRQDYVNIMSNYYLGSFAFEKKVSHDELIKVQDDIYQKLILTNVPDIHGQYYINGKDAFLANNEIVNKKIQDLLLINFDTNYASEIKSIAFLSRNLVNDFHWSFFKRINIVQQDRGFINTVFIVGDDTQTSIMGKMLNVESETGKLVKKMIIEVGEKNI